MTLRPIGKELKTDHLRIDPVLLFIIFSIIKVLPRGKGSFARLVGRCFNSYFNNSALKTRHGALLKIVPASLDFYTTMLSQNRSFDYWVFDTCKSYLKPGDVFYDIGSNVGYMSIEMAQCVDKSIKIYAFEAQRDLAINVNHSASLNSFENVHSFQCAISDHIGEVKFVNEKHSIHGHILKSTNDSSNSITVDAYTIDSLVKTNIIPPPNVIKIDVEGAEFKVLKGMKNIIIQFKPTIVFEISEDTYDFDITPSEIILFLSSLINYNYFWASGSYREKIEIKSSELEEKLTSNKNILCEYIN